MQIMGQSTGRIRGESIEIDVILRYFKQNSDKYADSWIISTMFIERWSILNYRVKLMDQSIDIRRE